MIEPTRAPLSPTDARLQPEISRKPAQSIRTRLLTLALGLTVIALAVVILAAVETAGGVIRQAQDVSSESLRAQAESYLVQINNSVAGQSALILDRAARDIQSVADAAGAIFSGKISLPGTTVSMTVGPEGQLMNSAKDVSSVFVPNVVWKDTDYNPQLYRAVQRDIELSSYLDLTLQPVKENNPNAAAIYLGTVHDVTRYYPNIRLGEVVPADFRVTQRPWYLSALERNPDLSHAEPVWSPVYFDATGLGLVTTIAAPVVTDQGELVGVVGLDITLEEVRRNIENSRFLSTGYSFLIDENGNAVILPEQAYQDLLGSAPDAQQPTPNLIQTAKDPALAQVLEKMISGEEGFAILTLNGREFYMAFAPVRSSSASEMIIPGWSLASVVAAEDVLRNVAGLQQALRRTTQETLFTRILPLGALISLALIALAWIGANRLVDPILKLSASAGRLAVGDWRSPAPVLRQVAEQNDDEIGLLAYTLGDMAAQLEQTLGQLEARVAERTQALEHRTLQLQTAAEVAHEIAQAQDLASLLRGAVDLISERFGYYNVGIFLVDELSEYAHLKAASGELGRQLLQKEIRLRVGQEGMVGYVTRFGQPRIAADVSQERAYVAERLLPDTRSELTLPLRSGPKIIGALDVQSAQPNAFSQDDITVLQTLADQLATAIENVRLTARLLTTLEEANLATQQQARQAWQRLAAQRGELIFEYDRLEARRIPPSELRNVSGALLRVPVSLRGQVIGYIGLEADDPEREWSADELAIVEATANQAALTVENARLLLESQQRAARERIAAEVTAQIRASLDMQAVLQSAVQEIAQRMGIAQVEVELTAMDSDGNSPANGDGRPTQPDRREQDEPA